MNRIFSKEKITLPLDTQMAPSKEKKRDLAENEFRIKKKIKKDTLDKQQFLSNENNKNNIMMDTEPQLKKPVQITLPKFNISKLFYDILSLANKDEDFLMMISNILTTGSRQLVNYCFFFPSKFKKYEKNKFFSELKNDKKVIIRKKRTTLQGSNLSQQEYLKKEKELLKIEKEEIEEVKSSIISRLSSSKIKGFETKETIIENLKLQKIEESKSNEIEFEINEEDFNELKSLQLKLLDKLLEERSFVNPDLKISKYKNLSDKMQAEEENKLKASNENVKVEGGHNKKINEMKRNENKKTIIMYKYLEEGEISEKDYLNEKTKEIFADFEKFCKMSKENVFTISKYEKANLLEFKTDYLYIEEKFQKHQFEKFQKIIREIEVNLMFLGILNVFGYFECFC